jgi:hypothetical protein
VLHRIIRLASALLIAAPAVLMVGAPAVSGQESEAGIPAASADAAGTVWLCRPGLANDPCTANLDTTIVPAQGAPRVQDSTPAAHSPFDCFYVYPTVSTERMINADLKVQQAETHAAMAQASRFSQVCSVWAPMYRQTTLLALALGLSETAQPHAIAYQSLLAGWQDYLEHYNHGRPIIFIGHSQGAALLIKLLQSNVDPEPALRGQIVSAIILGGNVTVPSGKNVGGSFQYIPACRSTSQTGCVIAYSSFPAEPPANSLFGRPGQGVGLQPGQTLSAGLQVLCTNPAALQGGVAPLDPYFPVADLAPAHRHLSTPWGEYPDLYSGQCLSAHGATWLQVSKIAPGDQRLDVPQAGGPRWGYHVADVNLALGNLVQDVRAQEAAYQAAHP